MALIYFYDSTELDKQQLTEGLKNTDHSWQFVSEQVKVDNLNPDTEVISVFVTSTITRQIIESLPRLKLIACRSTGFNNIDLAAAKEHGVAVVNVPTYGESTVAEYTFALLLALTRKLPQTFDAADEKFDPADLIGIDLNGRTIGVIGTGHIGQHVIRIAKGFEMKVIAYDPFPNEQLKDDLQFEYASIEDLLSTSDIVTLHAPFTPETRHMINAERIQIMKPNAIVINAARGELIDTKALIDGLNSGKLGGAALDVIEGEALLRYDEEIALLRSSVIPAEMLRHGVELSALKMMPNVILAPHNAFNTVEAIGRINQTTADNIIKYWYGEIPNEVKPPKKPHGRLFITRHAESEWNLVGRWSGQKDVHLSEGGFHAAAHIGEVLKQLDVKIDQAYCSEQIRTRETLEAIIDTAQQIDVPVVRSNAINERDYGEYTGRDKWHMQELIGDSEFDKIRRGWDVPIPKGETLKMVYERAVPFYVETVVPDLNNGKNVLIVAHGNTIRALIKFIESISDEGIADVEMPFGIITEYLTDENGKLVNRKDYKTEAPKTNA